MYIYYFLFFNNIILGGHVDSFIVKRDILQKKVKDPEYKFYLDVFNKNSDKLEENLIFQQFCPKLLNSFENEKGKFVEIENLFYNRENASSLDVKIGKITYMPDATPKKQKEE